MSIQSTIHTDWKCSKNRSYAKTICKISNQAESFAMLHFSRCEKENLVILMMRVRQEISAYFNSGQKEFHGEIVTADSRKSSPICGKYHGNLYGDYPSTESSVAWTGPLLTEVTFYNFEEILKNIRKVKTTLFRIAPQLSDF